MQAISGPINGGTEITLGARYVYGVEGDVDFPDVTAAGLEPRHIRYLRYLRCLRYLRYLQPDELGSFGFPDHGDPRCVFLPLAQV